MTDQRRVVVLGSTGSIGTQAIAVAQAAPDRFRVTAICSGGGDLALLADQAVALRVAAVGVGREDAGPELQARLAATWPTDSPAPEVLVGRSTAGSARGIRRGCCPERDRGRGGAYGRPSRRLTRDASSLWRTRNRWWRVGPWSPDGRSPASLCRWTQNIPRWPNACAAGARTRSAGSS
jgi:hypothetical protein